jgi:hypothetical protein
MTVLVPPETPRTWQVDDVLVTEPGVIRRAIGAAAIGNITEWYDFGVYAYFEPTIRKVFFSGLSAWIHRPDCARKRVVTAEMPFDLGECGLLKLAAPGSKGHLWDAIVAHRGHDTRQVR